MASINKVLLMGNLTRDPELRYLPQSQTPVVAIGVAVNRRWKNQQGEWQEEATFIDCEGFSKTAEFINKWFKKGQVIFIEGRLKLDQWQDKDGGKRSKLKVVIEAAQFADAKGSGAGGGEAEGGEGGYGGGAPQQRSAPQRSAPRSPAAPARGPSQPPPTGDDENPHDEIPEEKIPF